MAEQWVKVLPRTCVDEYGATLAPGANDGWAQETPTPFRFVALPHAYLSLQRFAPDVALELWDVHVPVDGDVTRAGHVLTARCIELMHPRPLPASVYAQGLAAGVVALNHVPHHLRTPSVLAAAMRHPARNLKHMAPQHRTRERCLTALRASSTLMPYVPRALRIDLSFVEAAARAQWTCIRELPQDSLSVEAAVAAVQQTDRAYRLLRTELRAAPEVLGSLRLPRSFAVFPHLPESARKDAALCLAAVKSNVNSAAFVPDECLTPEVCDAMCRHVQRHRNDRVWALMRPPMWARAVHAWGMLLCVVPRKCRTLDVCMAAVHTGQDCARHVPPEVWTAELVRAAVSRVPAASLCVPAHLRAHNATATPAPPCGDVSPSPDTNRGSPSRLVASV